MIVDYWKKKLKKNKIYLFMFIILPIYIFFIFLAFNFTIKKLREKKYKKICKEAKRCIENNLKEFNINISNLKINFMVLADDIIHIYEDPLSAKRDIKNAGGHGEIYLIIEDNGERTDFCIFNSNIMDKKLT